MKVNKDILLYIISFCSTKDKIRWRLVCRFLRDNATRSIRMIPTKPENITKLHLTIFPYIDFLRIRSDMNLEDIKQLKYLKYIDIDSNTDKSIVTNLRQLKLKAVSMNNFDTYGNDVSIIPSNIEGVNLRSDEPSVLDITPLKSLNDLILTNIDLVGYDKKTITNISYLRLHKCWVMDLSDFTGLTKLILTSDTAQGINLNEPLSKLTNLTSLSIFVSNRVVTKECLSKLTNLRRLYLGKCFVSGESFQYLTNLSSLKVGKNYDGKGAKYLSRLRYLDIAGCDDFNGDDLKYLTNLRQLVVKMCPHINDEHMANLNLTQLNALRLSNNENITDTTISQCTNLVTAMIDMCPNITDHGLRHLVKLKKLITPYTRAIKYNNQRLLNSIGFTLDVIEYLKTKSLKVFH